MAQPTDLTGMLTEGLFQPTQQAVPSSYRESILGAAQSAGTGLRRGIGAMTGADTRTNQEVARASMQGLDINNPAHQPKILEIVRKYAPEKEAAMVAQFAQQGRVRAEKEKAEEKAKVAADLEETRYQEQLSLDKREVAAAELKAQALSKPKVHEPKINADKDGRITVISTDPTNAGTIISRASTKSEAIVEAEKEVERQEKLSQSQQLVVKRNTLIGQADSIRLALKEAEEARTILPLATGFAMQKTNPLYATTIGGQTYQKLVDAVASVQSAQALNSLAELKQQSSTGASGLGATNAMEFSALQSNIRKLNPDVPSTIEAGLQAIERNLDNIIKIDQNIQPNIDWDNPAYAHMVKTKTDGSRAYSYDGENWYNIIEPIGE